MERMEELLKEQTETAQERVMEQRALDERNWLNSKLESQQRLQKFYTEKA